MIRIRRVASPDLSEIHRRMEQVMESLLQRLGPASAERGFLPRADIHETASGMLVTLDLAGVRREEIEILIEGDFLRVSGVRREPEVGECLRWHQMEISYGPFERVVALPPDADLENISAAYHDGFLQISVPRRSGGGRQVPVDIS